VKIREKGKRKKPSILITAGPTREKIDPIRFISNYSTGAFGYAIAKDAKKRGWPVILVSGPTNLPRPKGVRTISVESAQEMLRAVMRELKKVDCVIMAAAVSDWRPVSAVKSKIKRGKGRLQLNLTANPDILLALGRHKKQMLVGFALETEDLKQNAIEKLRKKNLDLIIANQLSDGMNVFGDNITDILIIDRDGKAERFRSKTKASLAKIILDKISGFTI